MDPVTIIGLAGTALHLIASSAQIVRNLNDLAQKYNSTDTTLRNIVRECKTLEAAVTQIKIWIEVSLAQMPTAHQQSMTPLQNALLDFAATLEPLDEEVSSMLSKAKPSGILPHRVRFRSVWNETKMKSHLDNLRWQASAIHFLLSSTQLLPQERIRRIESIAQAASQFREGSLFNDSGSAIDGTEFDFDHLLISTTAYRRAFRSQMRQQAGSHSQDEASATIAKEPSAASMTEYGVEGDLIDLSSDKDVPISAPYGQRNVVAMETGTVSAFHDHDFVSQFPSLAEVEESQRWLVESTPDGRIYYRNAFTGVETSPAYELAGARDLRAASKFWLRFKDRKGNYFFLNTKTGVHPTWTCVPSPCQHGGNAKVDSVTSSFDNPAGRIPLLSACDGWDIYPIQSLLKQNANVMARDSYCKTALHIAAHSGNFAAIKLLLDAGADINALDFNHDTPLHLAARNPKNSVLVKKLIKYGADKTIRNQQNWTPMDDAVAAGAGEVISELLPWLQDAKSAAFLIGGFPYIHIAAQWGHSDVIKRLLHSIQGGPVMWLPIVNQVSGMGSTALHEATSSRHEVLVKTLLNSGATDKPNATGCTPFHLSSANGDSDIVELFLLHNFDISVRSPGGWTPLHFAARHGHGPVISLLLKHGAKNGSEVASTPFHLAVYFSGRIDIVQLFLERWDYLNLPVRKTLHTPLHLAAGCGHTDLLLFLLQRGAQILPKKDGLLPLHFACASGYIECARYLLDFGVFPGAKGKWPIRNRAVSVSSLGIAIHEKNLEMIRLLMGYGADQFQVVGDMDALQAALVEGNLDIIDYFSSFDDIRHRNVSTAAPTTANQGRIICSTALHFVCQEGIEHRPAVVKWLLSRGISPDARDSDGNTPIHLAAMRDDIEIARILIEMGCNINWTNNKGQTPLHVAARFGALDAVKYLLRHGARVKVVDEYGDALQNVRFNSHRYDKKLIEAELKSKILGLLATDCVGEEIE